MAATKELLVPIIVGNSGCQRMKQQLDQTALELLVQWELLTDNATMTRFLKVLKVKHQLVMWSAPPRNWSLPRLLLDYHRLRGALAWGSYYTLALCM